MGLCSTGSPPGDSYVLRRRRELQFHLLEPRNFPDESFIIKSSSLAYNSRINFSSLVCVSLCQVFCAIISDSAVRQF